MSLSGCNFRVFRSMGNHMPLYAYSFRRAVGGNNRTPFWLVSGLMYRFPSKISLYTFRRLILFDPHRPISPYTTCEMHMPFLEKEPIPRYMLPGPFGKEPYTYTYEDLHFQKCYCTVYIRYLPYAEKRPPCMDKGTSAYG